jgi:hypothetical protein
MSMIERRGDIRKLATGGIYFGCGAAGALLALRYDLGTPTHVGPGGFPLLLSLILAALGLANLVQGTLSPYAGGLGSWRARAIYLLPLAVVFFGLTVERLGLVLAIIGTTIIACLANPTIRVIEIALICVALAIFGAGVFVYGLDLPFSLFPD